MKTFTIKSVFFFIILNLFATAMFANGVHFSLKMPNNINRVMIAKYAPIKTEGQSYVVGEFDNYLLVMKAKNDLNKRGVKATEIIAFHHEIPVSIADAFVILDNRMEQDKRISNPYTVDEMEAMLASVQNHEFFFTIQMGVFNEKNANAFFNFPKSYDERITSKGFYRYTYGEFKTLQDAKDALRMVKEYGLENVIIIAYDDMARIPLARAIEKQKQLLDNALAMDE